MYCWIMIVFGCFFLTVCPVSSCFYFRNWRINHILEASDFLTGHFLWFCLHQKRLNSQRSSNVCRTVDSFLMLRTSRHTFLLPSSLLPLFLRLGEIFLFSSHQPFMCEQAACNAEFTAFTHRFQWAWPPGCVLFRCFLCWRAQSCRWRRASC